MLRLLEIESRMVGFQFCEMKKFWRFVQNKMHIINTVELTIKMVKMVNFLLGVLHHN
jgi:hypothetical protein